MFEYWYSNKTESFSYIQSKCPFPHMAKLISAFHHSFNKSTMRKKTENTEEK